MTTYSVFSYISQAWWRHAGHLRHF